MPDDTTTDSTETTDDYTPPASQEELDRILSERLNRERAKYADYAALKEKAEKLDGLEDAQKTETQRLTDKLAAAEKAAADAQTASLRYRIATRYGIKDDVAERFLHGDDEATLVEAAEMLVEMAASKGETPAPRGPFAPGEGRAPAPANDRDAQAREVLGFG